MNEKLDSLGPERVPPSRLRYRYNCENILKVLSKYLEESSYKAFSEARKGRMPNVYCTISLPIPEKDPKILGDFPLKVYEVPPQTVQPFALPRRKWRDFWINSFAFQAHPYHKEDILTTLGVLFEHERINYLPFIGVEDGNIYFSKDFDKGVTELRLLPVHKTTFKKERFIAPFRDYYEFLPYYLNVVETMEKMFNKELYENTNLAASRISEELVWTRRTKDGRDIRINNPLEIPNDLVPWGAFEYFLENNKCWLDQTNCRRCDKTCWPNITVDIDPGGKVSRKEVIDALTFIQSDLDNEGIKYIVKFTGKRGFHITAYCNSFKSPECNYIPLKVLKHSNEMSTKHIKQTIETLSQDPFEVARDYIRCKTDYWRGLAKGKLNFLVHDMSDYAGNMEYVTVDASVKRRAYYITYYSLTAKKTVCLPVCSNGTVASLELVERIENISKNPSEILKHENELLDVEIKYNDSSFVKDFLEENERKIYKGQFEKVAKRLGIA